MICPKCGNTISQNEGFCGQCGTPNISQLPLLSVENNFSSSLSAPGNQQQDTFNIHPGTHYSPAGAPQPLPQQLPFNPPIKPPTAPLAEHPAHVQQQMPPRSAHLAHPAGQFTSQQQGNFYHDATEAIKPLADSRVLNSYASSEAYASSQPFISHGGQYSNAGYPQQPFVTGQQYHPGTRVQPPSTQHKQGNSPIVLIVSLCTIVVFLGTVVIGSLILTKHKDTPVHQTAQISATTRAVTPATTPTPILSPTPVPTPSPTIAPTPTPDPGFVWCGQLCAASNFTTEYPGTWQAGTSPTTNAIQFVNPAQADQYMLFKGQGPTVSDAGTLVSNELQTSYANQPGYTAPTSTSAATVSGETWIKALAYYQGSSQQEEVEVLATVHGSKAYVIDLNAPTSQFAAISGQAFAYILEKLQFLS
jgi:hypothetical protein